METAVDASSIAIIVLLSVSIVVTILRLVVRCIRRELWWDDVWVFVGLMAAALGFSALIISATIPFANLSVRAKSFVFWCLYFVQPTSIWATRLSIAVVIHYLTPTLILRRISRVGYICLALAWLAVTIAKIFSCGIPIPLIPFCQVELAVPSVGLCANLLGDGWLLVLSSLVITKKDTSIQHSRLLYSSFLVLVMIGIMDIGHAIFLILRKTFSSKTSGVVEMAISLLLCDILAYMMFKCQFFQSPTRAVTVLCLEPVAMELSPVVFDTPISPSEGVSSHPSLLKSLILRLKFRYAASNSQLTTFGSQSEFSTDLHLDSDVSQRSRSFVSRGSSVCSRQYSQYSSQTKEDVESC